MIIALYTSGTFQPGAILARPESSSWRRGSQRCSFCLFILFCVFYVCFMKRAPEVFILFDFHENTNMKHTKKKRGCKRCFFFTDLDMEIDIDKNCGRQEKAFAILAIN